MFTYVQPCSGAESNSAYKYLKINDKKENKKVCAHTVTHMPKRRWFDSSACLEFRSRTFERTQSTPHRLQGVSTRNSTLYINAILCRLHSYVLNI